MERFQTVRRCGRTGYAVADLPREVLMRLVETPESPLNSPGSTTIKAGNSALVTKAELDCGRTIVPVAYKRVRRKTLRKQLTQAFGPNRTLRTFFTGHRLLAKGVATARPLAVIVPDRWRISEPSWIATAWVEGGENLSTAVASCLRLPESRRVAAIRPATTAVGRLLGTLHAAGFSHRDLKPQNVMIRRLGGTIEAVLIDLDGAWEPPLLTRRTRFKNLARLAVGERSWRAFGPATRRRCLDTYLRTFESEPDAASFQAALAAAMRRRSKRAA